MTPLVTTGIYSNPAFVALAAAIPAAVLGVFGFRHSQRVDKVAEQGMIATVQNGTIAQMIDGLNKLVVNLQSDNATLRELNTTLRALNDRQAAAIKVCEELRASLSHVIDDPKPLK